MEIAKSQHRLICIPEHENTDYEAPPNPAAALCSRSLTKEDKEIIALDGM